MPCEVHQLSHEARHSMQVQPHCTLLTADWPLPSRQFRQRFGAGDLILLTKHLPAGGSSEEAAADSPGVLALVEAVDRDEASRERDCVQAFVNMAPGAAGMWHVSCVVLARDGSHVRSPAMWPLTA